MTSAITITTGQHSELEAIDFAIQPVQDNPAIAYLAALVSEASRRTMTSALNEIARTMGAPTLTTDNPNGKRAKTKDVTFLTIQWGELRQQQTAAIRARLIEKYPPATTNKMLAALRGVLNEAYDAGQMTSEEHRLALKKIKTVKGETLPAGREITDGEIIALVQTCKRDNTAAGRRDAALIAVLYAGGLRRAEIAALDLADYDLESGKVTIRSGKGRKDRTIYLTGGAKTALDVWLIDRELAPGALFNPVNKGGKVKPTRMTAQALYNILKKRGAAAGVENFACHDFRRTFISTLLDRNVDIVTVSKLAGHADPKQTAKYDRRGEEAKQRAADKIHFPY